jgi:hypothetical protein
MTFISQTANLLYIIKTLNEEKRKLLIMHMTIKNNRKNDNQKS